MLSSDNSCFDVILPLKVPFYPYPVLSCISVVCSEVKEEKYRELMPHMLEILNTACESMPHIQAQECIVVSHTVYFQSD